MKRFYGEDLHLNFLRGCVNDGACPLWDSCWARNMARRLAGRAGYPRDDPFKPHCPQRCPEVMMSALHRLRDARRPKVIAFNYMGDVALHEAKNVKAMADFCDLDECRRHTFLWLTKRPALLREKLGDVRLPANVWLGASVWDQMSADKIIPDLLDVPAAHHWLSIEPMWGPINLPDTAFSSILCDGCGEESTVHQAGDNHEVIYDVTARFPDLCGKFYESEGLDWMVVGCESGPKRRLFNAPFNGEYPVRNMCAVDVRNCEAAFLSAVRSLRDQCASAGTAFYCKQLPLNGEVVKDVAKFPADLQAQARPWRAIVKGIRNA